MMKTSTIVTENRNENEHIGNKQTNRSSMRRAGAGARMSTSSTGRGRLAAAYTADFNLAGAATVSSCRRPHYSTQRSLRSNTKKTMRHHNQSIAEQQHQQYKRQRQTGWPLPKWPIFDLSLDAVSGLIVEDF